MDSVLDWYSEYSRSVVDGQSFVGGKLGSGTQVRPRWSGTGTPPDVITIVPGYQSWFQLCLGFFGGHVRWTETGEWAQRTEPTWMRESDYWTREPFSVPAPTRIARAFSFYTDADGPSCMSPPIYSTAIGQVDREIQPVLDLDVGLYGVGKVGVKASAVRTRGTVTFAVDPTISFGLITGDVLAEVLYDEFVSSLDAEATEVLGDSLGEFAEVLGSAFSPPDDWGLPAPTELSGDAGDRRGAVFELQVGQRAPGIGFFALGCQDLSNPEIVQISDVFAIETDREGYVTPHPDVSDLDLRRAAGWAAPEA
jgi:hypothetical protein